MPKSRTERSYLELNRNTKVIYDGQEMHSYHLNPTHPSLPLLILP